MIGENTTRRRFLVAAITYSGLLASGAGISVLRSSSAWAQSSDSDSIAALGRYARLLFPHDNIDDAVYAEVMGGILEVAADDSALDSVLADALAALNSAQSEDWFDLDETTQIAGMKAVQGEAFFAAIQSKVQGRFYGHPSVWKLIGYPGSSKEHGGYVDRGFDDIDWLPEEA